MAPRNSAHAYRIYASYAFDYIIVVVLIVLSGIIGSLPRFQEFSLYDISLQYSYVGNETVSSPVLGVIAVIIPICIISIFAVGFDLYKYHTSLKTRLWELNCGLLGLALSIMLTLLITASIKNVVGRPRP